MKIVIVGAGAMGCRYGSAFHKAGAEVWLYDISKAHVDSINQRGLLIHNGKETESVPIPATTEISDVPAPDLAVLFTKTMYTESALRTAVKIFRPDTAVLTMQNGLGNIEKISIFVPQEHIIAGITSYASDLLGPGEIEAKSAGITKIMPLGEEIRNLTLQIAELLNSSGLVTQISENLMKDVWEKVAFNCALNTSTTLTLLPVGKLGNTLYGQELVRMISSEVIRVAHADGVNADEAAVHKLIEQQFRPEVAGDHKPSMLQDRLAGRQTEIDAIVGAVIEKAHRHGVPVSCLEVIYRLIKVIEKNYDYQSLS